jgi:hypothetical protein
MTTMKAIFNSFSIFGAINLETRNMEQNLVCKARRIIATTSSIALIGTFFHAQCALAAVHAAPATVRALVPARTVLSLQIKSTAAPSQQDGGGKRAAAPLQQDGGGKIKAVPSQQDGGGK